MNDVKHDKLKFVLNVMKIVVVYMRLKKQHITDPLFQQPGRIQRYLLRSAFSHHIVILMLLTIIDPVCAWGCR